MKKVVFITPSRDWQAERDWILERRVNPDIPNQESPHIGIAGLMAVLERFDIRTEHLDMVTAGLSIEDVADRVASDPPLLVGLTAYTVQIRAAAEVARAIKQASPGVTVCIGGPHASVIPERTLREFPVFDFVVSGEAERVLPQAIEELGQGRRPPGIRGLSFPGSATSPEWEPIPDLNTLPFPAWEKYDLNRYGGVYPHRTARELPMVSGRGCPYRCVFCSRALGDRVRRRSVANVIAEIRRNIEAFGCTSLSFLDDTFAIGQRWISEFLAAMVSEGLNREVTWSCETRVDTVTPDLLRKMEAAGCYYIFYGLEGADEEVLRTAKKEYTVNQIRNAIRWTKESGIVPSGAFIIGLPGDTEATVMKAIELGHELELFSITFPLAVPFPGTELREMALRGEHGMRIMSDDWDDYGKQEPGVLESEALSWDERRELQALAYATHPKKDYDTYRSRLLSGGA